MDTGSTLGSSRINFGRSWRFKLGDSGGAQSVGYADDEWRVLDLPHDWSIELERKAEHLSGWMGGFARTGVGWYRKSFTIPRQWQGKRITIAFDGAYQESEVWINGQYLGIHHYGYTPFDYDLTPYLHADGDNLIAVRVDNAMQPASRWYSGSGIYRDVWLEASNPVAFTRWGIAVTAPYVSDGEAVVRVEATVANSTDCDARVEIHLTVLSPRGMAVAGLSRRTDIGAADEGVLIAELAVEAPERWSLECPQLYSLVCSAFVGGALVDEQVTLFGIRTIEVDADRGFRLNGTPLKLRGACVHHDNGILGAASYARSETRKVETLKANGYNAVRCAHNPPATAFLDACDRLGMLVIDEAFDIWRVPKVPYDYHRHFDHAWQQDLDVMLFRDRNHPSVVMWSIGNEIPERGSPEGAEIAQRLAAHIRGMDPTRPVTSAICLGEDFEKMQAFLASLDVAGYNYMNDFYVRTHEQYPQRVICATESFPLTAFDFWMAVRDHAYVIGDFVWTGLDYLGESAIGWVNFEGEPAPELRYPWHQANCGDLDLCGFKRPQSFYRDILWERGEKLWVAVHPPVPEGKDEHISPWGWTDVQQSWSWDVQVGRPLQVDVYSACDSVELFVNGRPLGRAETSRATRYIASFSVPYEPGALRAVGCAGEREVAVTEVVTVGAPAAIALSADRDRVAAQFGDLIFCTVEVVDASGAVHPQAHHDIKLSVDGPATLLAFGSANGQSKESYTSDHRRAYRGRCLAAIRTIGERGTVTITATAEGLRPATIAVACA